MDELTRVEARLIAAVAVAAAVEGDMDALRDVLAAAGPDVTAEVAALLAQRLAVDTSPAEAVAAVQIASLDAAAALPDTLEAALIEVGKLEHEIGGRA
ncbi:hypothetical protein MYP14_20880 [Rhodococcus pyridinivorans]|uniref:hypothetical protein n=1 Tax=Rhodococcus pyridinivorans TaxID=103816 RepID=UPI001FFEB330|nr:hypothetical protein [Rhodococcus pyridinivorans]UPK63149.1 hypothetical protein MYP14_20880 [Rhodococcus pyridinivorans]